MTALLNLWGLTMDSYTDEDGKWEPCTPWLDFRFLAAAALFGGFGFATLIFCLEKYL